MTLDFEASWEEALDKIEKAIGRRVYFSWTDADETVVVDTPEEFEDLLIELEEDWEDEMPELNGEIDVEIVEVEGLQLALKMRARKPGSSPLSYLWQ